MAGEDVTEVMEKQLKPLAQAYSDAILKMEQKQQAAMDAALGRRRKKIRRMGR